MSQFEAEYGEWTQENLPHKSAQGSRSRVEVVKRAV